MVFLSEAMALFCLVYFIILFFYSGPATSMIGMWLVLAAALFLFSLWLRRLKQRKMSLRLRVMSITAVLTCCTVIAATIAVLAGTAVLSSDKEADYCIVLGASVRGRKPSSSLRRRIERAQSYAESHPETILVLSGGMGEGEEISEARAMYDALLDAGIPSSRLVLEDHSGSTDENLAYSRSVILQCEFDRRQRAMRMAALGRKYLPTELQDELGTAEEISREEEPTVAVLTSSFHLFRAETVAKKLGFGNVVGVAASTDPVLALHLWLRESAAVLYEKFMGRL